MRGLPYIPDSIRLAHAYDLIRSARVALPPAELALFSQWCRLDPRLGEQLVEHIARHWSRIDPHLLRDALEHQPWPSAMGVLLEQAALHAHLSRRDASRLRSFSKLTLHGLPLGEGGSFFIATRAFAGRLAAQDAELSLKIYLKWGYLGRELMLNSKARPAVRSRTLLAAAHRAKVLGQLIEESRDSGAPISVRSYREALGNAVGLRQAELDLAADPRLRPRGRTRGRVYLPAPKPGTRQISGPSWSRDRGSGQP